jgi:NTP pyrophosphatase (non-canonical NTP hydrolase)
MHSELSEALDELRNGNMEGAANELMDCVIRICDYCEQRGLRLNQALNRIRAHREGRPPLHGRQW